MKIKVRSKLQSQAFRPPLNSVAISIRDADAERNYLSPDFDDVLFMEFDDFDPERWIGDWEIEDAILFDRRHAREILNFVEKHKGKDLMLVHCNAGVSRSPAVAIAIAEIMGASEQEVRDLMEAHSYYNRHVLKVMRIVAAERAGQRKAS